MKVINKYVGPLIIFLLLFLSFMSLIDLIEMANKPTQQQLQNVNIRLLLLTNEFGNVYQGFIYGNDLEIDRVYNIGQQ